jgi:hypothetical protein
MTLCIAAICRDENKERAVVVSCDRRVTVGFMTGEWEYKLRQLTPAWLALMAGNLPLSRELASGMQTWLRDKADEIDQHNIIEYLRVPVDSLRRSLHDRYVQKKLGMNAGDLFKIGKSLPEAIFSEITQDLTKLEYDVEMLLVGVVASRVAYLEYTLNLIPLRNVQTLEQ